MISYKFVKPRIFPHTAEPRQVDRLQNISGDLSLNREALREIGRDGLLGHRKGESSLSFSATQFEHGSMSFWRALAGKDDPESGESGAVNYVELSDIEPKRAEFAAFLTDDDDTFVGTIYIPSLRANGFSLGIGDPNAIIERSFDLVAEKYRIIDGNYLAYDEATVAAPGNEVITLDPVAIEYADGKYVYKVIRVRAGTASVLNEGSADNEWAYAAGDVTVKTCLAEDVVKVFYAAATAYTTVWTDNDDDPTALLAEYAEIRMKVGAGDAARIYRLQSVGIDVSFEREDHKEIGNHDIVQTGVTGRTVTVSLDRFAEDFTLEKILADEDTYPDIDPENFSEDIQVQIKLFEDRAHTQFAIGFLMDSMTPASTGFSNAVEEFTSKTTSLTGESLKISDDAGDIDFV